MLPNYMDWLRIFIHLHPMIVENEGFHILGIKVFLKFF